MNTEIKELRTQCEVLRTKIDALVAKLDAADVENKMLRTKVTEWNDIYRRLLATVEGAEQLMVIERCAQLKGRGVPCHVKADRIYHDITGALLN